jgi:hypothetical protein
MKRRNERRKIERRDKRKCYKTASSALSSVFITLFELTPKINDCKIKWIPNPEYSNTVPVGINIVDALNIQLFQQRDLKINVRICGFTKAFSSLFIPNQTLWLVSIKPTPNHSTKTSENLIPPKKAIASQFTLDSKNASRRKEHPTISPDTKYPHSPKFHNPAEDFLPCHNKR